MNQRLFSYPDPEVLREGSFLDDVSLVGEEHQQVREGRETSHYYLSLMTSS
jgi:hypothetical protein